jgi:hypothetical protein
MALVEVVTEDLVHLRDTWDDDITESRLRQDSGILRRLLIDRGGTFRRAWRATGNKREPRVIAPDLKTYLGGFDRRKIVFMVAGGIVYHGIGTAVASTVEGGTPPGSHLPQGYNPLTEQRLSSFMDGPTIIAGGVTINRRELINYITNKLGGVHYDESRQADDSASRALDALPVNVVYVGGNSSNPDLRYLEMLAVGRLLVDSPDVRSWMAEQQGAAPVSAVP